MANKKKSSKRTQPIVGFGSQRLIVQLSKAEAFREQRKFGKALEILETLDKEFPNNATLVGCLANLYHDLKDLPNYEQTCDRLNQLHPDDPDYTLMLGGAYLANTRPVLALRTFRRYLEKWPNHRRAEEIRQLVETLEPGVRELLIEKDYQGDDALELAALSEEAQAKLQLGDYLKSRQINEELLRRQPDFIPALNNLSLTYFFDSRLDEAIATSKRVLELDGNNYHALSNLTRYCYLGGQFEEAKQWGDRLKAVESDANDLWVKKAEGLSYLGDDRSVLEIFKDAEKAGHLKSPAVNPFLYHVAAVASLRLGLDKQARQYWQEALKLNPGFELALENLADLNQPISKRNAPWAYSRQYWLTNKAIVDLKLVFSSSLEDEKKTVPQMVATYLQQHPEVATLLPILLERGDPSSREFALHIALGAETPEMLAVLRDFAFSDKGSDEMRQRAAQAVSQAGLLPPGMVRMWMKGQWQELLLMGFEIHDEPSSLHSPKVEKLYGEAIVAARNGNFKKSEALLKKALEIEPDAPDLLNNLSGSYGMQGRKEEALELMKQIHQRHPDYLFARVGLAQDRIHKGEIDAAETLLEPLLAYKRLHYSELAALCGVQVELHLAKKQPEIAESWLQMGEKALPNHPDMQYLRQHLNKISEKGTAGRRIWKTQE